MSKHLLARYQKIEKGVRKKLLKCIKIFLKKNKNKIRRICPRTMTICLKMKNKVTGVFCEQTYASIFQNKYIKLFA